MGMKAELKNCKWHFHHGNREETLIQGLEKNNNKNIVPIT